MKKIILNTKQADEISSDRKNYKYYFDKPVVIDEKSTLSLQSITKKTLPPPTPVAYDQGLLTIGNMSIDYSTIPTSIYGSFSYVGEWDVDLDDTTKCSVYNSSGGASTGSGSILKFFSFKDYGTSGFPKTTVLAEVTSFGINYQVGDYIIINETAFPSGYVVGVVNMRINITGISTSEITEYPKGIITSINLNPNYIGEVSTNTNYTHTPSTNNGQLTDFIWGSGNQYIELKEIVNGGVGYSIGDVFYVNKNDALPTKTTYFTPFQIEVTAITNTATPPPPNNDANFRIYAKNLLHINNNIIKSDKNNNILIYNKQNSLFVNRDEIINYRICDLPPQVLMGMELFIESTTDNGLSSNDTVCLHLKIS